MNNLLITFLGITYILILFMTKSKMSAKDQESQRKTFSDVSNNLPENMSIDSIIDKSKTPLKFVCYFITLILICFYLGIAWYVSHPFVWIMAIIESVYSVTGYLVGLRKSKDLTAERLIQPEKPVQIYIKFAISSLFYLPAIWFLIVG